MTEEAAVILNPWYVTLNEVKSLREKLREGSQGKMSHYRTFVSLETGANRV